MASLRRNFLYLIFHSMLCDEEGRRATEQIFQSLPELGLPDKREWPNQRSHSKNVHLNPKNKSPLKTIFMWKVTTLTQHMSQKLPTFSLRKHLDTLILLQRLPNTPSKILTLHSQQTLHLPSKHFAPLKKCLRISINCFSKRSKHVVRK